MTSSSSSVQPKPIQEFCQRRKRIHSGGESRNDNAKKARSRDNITRSACVSSVFDANCLLDISFSSKSLRRRIKIEEIVEFLKQQSLALQKIFDSKENGYFNQCTVRFNEKNTKSNISYQGIHLKFKRTNPLIDQRSFILKLTVESTHDPVAREKISHYIDALTTSYSYKITNLLSQRKQILLIQCDNIIDHRTTQQKLGVMIELDIKRVNDDDDDAIPCVSSDQVSTESHNDNQSPQVTVYDRRICAMVANHPIFSIEYKNNIPFPRIGDEPFDFDYKLIAEYMIDETYQKLKTSVHYPLIVSFVLLPEQHDTYGAFADPLETIRIIEDKPTSISFDKQNMELKRSQ
ncbi:unnamed protein product [Rotaria sp. Silwood2]|nr:unnamed protein product [Rotaria sp. Silwood2]